MSEIEKIKRYIERTGVTYPTGTPYQMRFSDFSGLLRMAGDSLADALCLAFDCGRAKGERSARAAQKAKARRAQRPNVAKLYDSIKQQDKQTQCAALLLIAAATVLTEEGAK